MKSQVVKYNTPVIVAFTTEEAIAGEVCPYCGKAEKKIREHIETCEEAQKNKAIQKRADKSLKWAYHDLCGKCFVINRSDGLCIIENDYTRYCVPISSLRFGAMSEIVEMIEEYDLSLDECEKLINIIRIKSSNQASIPNFPQLWPGCEVEVQMGNMVKTGRVKKRNGSNYKIEVGNKGKIVNISPKHIIRML